MIEPVTQDNLADLLPLMRAYQTFYHVETICDERNAAFFSQFGPKSNLGCQFLYIKDGQAVGFATVYFKFSSTVAAKTALMNDLFVMPQARGAGVGEALIEHGRDYARLNGAVRLEWTTALDNHIAQGLYDKLATHKSTWHMYTYPT